MPLAPALRTMLDQLAAMGTPPLSEQSVDAARAAIRMLSAVDGEPEPVRSVEDRTISGPAGDIGVRVYRPADAAPLPVLVWFHGGGWVIGDLETADPTARKLANRSGALVVSVDYRLAPEHPFPAGPEDAWAATRWVAEHGAELGADPDRVAVGGDSAGGNLAALVALRAARRGAPRLSHQLLVYPATDLTHSHPSFDENGEGYLLTADSMLWFRGHYLGEHADPKDPVVSPLHADNLHGAAPATIITAGFDPLRDEGAAYAERLRDADVAVTYRCYDDMLHGFVSLGSLTPTAGEAVDLAATELRRAYGTSTQS